MKIRLFTIPNIITLCNLLCGSAAVVAALAYGNLTLSFTLIIIAAVCDFFDGFTARLLGCSSPIGLQLDSLADMVSFGLAPSVMLYVACGNLAPMWVGEGVAQWLPYAVFVVVALAALRLAKFNIDDTQRSEFEGLPTPACTMLCASVAMLISREMFSLPLEVLVVATIVVAWLQISPVRMFALKFHGFGWSGNGLRYSFMIVSAVLIIALKLYSIPVIIVLYIVLSAIRWIATQNR